MDKQKKKIKKIKKYDNKKEYTGSKGQIFYKKNKKHIRSFIGYIIFFLILLTNVVLIFKAVSNPEKTPSVFGRKAFIIISGSMSPEIEIGDIVITKSDENVDNGKIIAYRKDSTIIVHRVVKDLQINGETMYQTKGDRNTVEDKELVAKSKIEGVVVTKIPYVGNILMWLYNNMVWIILALLILIIINVFVLK